MNLTFVEHPSYAEKGVSAEHAEIPLGSPTGLEDIDVTISTVERYRVQLAKAENDKGRDKPVRSPFFSSPPVSLGYTNASMLDRIIAGEEVNEDIS